MRKTPVCLALAHLSALIWLCVCSQPLAAAEREPEGSFKPVQGEAAVPAPPAPGARAKTPGARYQGEERPVTTFKLPPKKAAARADRKAAKRSRAPEKMSPTQSYPPPQYQAAPVAEPALPDSAADKRRGRKEKRPVTTIELPKKQPKAQRGEAYGQRSRRPAEAAPVNPAYQPGPVQGPAPAVRPERAERSPGKSRQRAERKSVVQERSPAPVNPAYQPGPVQGPAPAVRPERAERSPRNSRQRTERKSVVQERSPGPGSVAPARAADERRQKKSRIKERSRSRSTAPDRNPVAVNAPAPPAPEPAGSRPKNRREARAAAAPLPVLPGPAPGLTSEQEMARAYQAFDLAYSNSLGKTRKELDMLWGFPMQKMGDNGVEVAYGFRQKGLLNLPPEPAGRASGKKKKAYYASSSIDPSLPGQYFTCLVVLWVDKKGRGVVVDGEAVGDCFIAETLSRKPDHFER